jgi:hypothetical protein
MVQNMKQRLRSWGALAMAGVTTVLSVGIAQPATAATATTLCPVPSLSQPFAGDSRWYTLAPGESADNFTGTGWILTGGAKIVTTKLPDGGTGSVLDLPAGSTATSPAMCVDNTYPLARMDTRTLGKAPDNSTKFYTQLVGSSALSGGMPVLGNPTWSVSPPDNVAGSGTAAEQVQFKFVAGSHAADLQVVNLYIDPSMRH